MNNINLRVNPRKLREFLIECFMARLVPYVSSSPGMGKSEIAKSVANEFKLFVIDLRLSTCAPEDLSGLPRFDDNGFAYFAPFAGIFPLEGMDIPEGYEGWLLLLDEFPSASRSVQAAAYKLILDRMVGQYKLHDAVFMMAAGNLTTDRAIADPLGTAMQSRLVHLEMQVNFDEWLADVALKRGYDPRIVAFLSQYNSKLMNFDPRHQEKTFACPRTWDFVERLIHRPVEEGGLKVMLPINPENAALYAGCIGEGVASEFVNFCAVWGQVVKIKDILDDPHNCPVPDTTSLRWATVTMMLEHVNEKTFEKISAYADNFTMDFKVLFFRGVMVRKPELRRHPLTIKAFSSLSQYLNYVS